MIDVCAPSEVGDADDLLEVFIVMSSSGVGEERDEECFGRLEKIGSVVVPPPSEVGEEGRD